MTERVGVGTHGLSEPGRLQSNEQMMFVLKRNLGANGHILEQRQRHGGLVTTREIIESREGLNGNSLVWWGYSGRVCRILWKTNSALYAKTTIWIGSGLSASQRWEFPFWPTRVHVDSWCVRSRRTAFEVTKRTVACLGQEVSYRSQSRLLAASVRNATGSRFVVARRLSPRRVDLMCAIVIVQSLSDRMYF